MRESTSQPFPSPSRRGVPSGAETFARQAFQARHPEVGFAFRDGCWAAYWADEAWAPRHRTAATLGELLDVLADEFG